MQNRLFGGLVAFAVCLGHAMANQVFITNFDKDNNIYTNLNQQFPFSGTGVPGSGVGVANASYLYDPATFTSPNMVLSGTALVNNGIDFDLTSNSTGQDFEQLTGGQTLTIPVNLSNVSSVYILASAYFGTSDNITFNGSSSSETFSNVYFPDFNGGAGSGGINNVSAVNGSSTDNLFDQSVLIVQDVGAGGTGNSTNGAYNNYDLTEASFLLNPSFGSQTLDSITIQSNGNTTLVLGVTAVQASAVPEPAAFVPLAAGLLGILAYRKRRTI
jgi:hypothetical protein